MMHANKTLEFKQQHDDYSDYRSRAEIISLHFETLKNYVSYTKTGCEHVDFCLNMRVCQDSATSEVTPMWSLEEVQFWFQQRSFGSESRCHSFSIRHMFTGERLYSKLSLNALEVTSAIICSVLL